MKRLAVICAVLAVAAPGFARAETAYGPPYAAGPQGGDQYNNISADTQTGQMSILRYSLNAPLSGGLGCGGQGGFANFAVSHAGGDPVTKVSVDYADALVGPYSFAKVGVRSGDAFVNSRVERGILEGDGTIEVLLGEPVSGPITIWFGLETSSACPPGVPLEYARATFTAVRVG